MQGEVWFPLIFKEQTLLPSLCITILMRLILFWLPLQQMLAFLSSVAKSIFPTPHKYSNRNPGIITASVALWGAMASCCLPQKPRRHTAQLHDKVVFLCRLWISGWIDQTLKCLVNVTAVQTEKSLLWEWKNFLYVISHCHFIVLCGD